MNPNDFEHFDDIYFKEFPGWGEAPATVWTIKRVRQEIIAMQTAEGADPYELLPDFVKAAAGSEAIIAMRGWAAPTGPDEDVRPSEHNARQRVIVYTHLNGKTRKVTVCIHREGAGVEVMENQGSGALHDSIHNAIREYEETNK